MAGTGTEEEAQSVCQVEGCDDPPGYLFHCGLTWDVVLCASHYREVVLDLKEVKMKPFWPGPVSLAGVKKL